MVTFAVYDWLAGRQVSGNNYFLAGVVVLGIALFVSRVVIISRVFEAGMEETATISNTGFFRGRGTIRYTYSFQGEKYDSYNQVSSSRRTRAVMVGQELTVLVDQTKPKRAFIKKLYL